MIKTRPLITSSNSQKGSSQVNNVTKLEKSAQAYKQDQERLKENQQKLRDKEQKLAGERILLLQTLQNAETEKASVDASNRGLRQLIQQVAEDSEQLTQLYQVASQRYGSLDKTFNAFSKLYNRAAACIDTAITDEALQKMETKMQSLSNQQTAVNDALTHYGSETAAAKARLTALSEECARLGIELGKSRAEEEKRKDEVESLSRNLESVHIEAEAARKRSEKAGAARSKSDLQLGRASLLLEQMLRDHVAEGEALNAQMAAAEAGLLAAKAKRDSAKSGAADAAAVLSQAQKQHSAVKQQFQEQVAQVHQGQDEVKQLGSEMECARVELEEEEEEIASLTKLQQKGQQLQRRINIMAGQALQQQSATLKKRMALPDAIKQLAAKRAEAALLRALVNAQLDADAAGVALAGRLREICTVAITGGTTELKVIGDQWRASAAAGGIDVAADPASSSIAAALSGLADTMKDGGEKITAALNGSEVGLGAGVEAGDGKATSVPGGSPVKALVAALPAVKAVAVSLVEAPVKTAEEVRQVLKGIEDDGQFDVGEISRLSSVLARKKVDFETATTGLEQAKLEHAAAVEKAARAKAEHEAELKRVNGDVDAAIAHREANLQRKLQAKEETFNVTMEKLDSSITASKAKLATVEGRVQALGKEISSLKKAINDAKSKKAADKAEKERKEKEKEKKAAAASAEKARVAAEKEKERQRIAAEVAAAAAEKERRDLIAREKAEAHAAAADKKRRADADAAEAAAEAERHRIATAAASKAKAKAASTPTPLVPAKRPAPGPSPSSQQLHRRTSNDDDQDDDDRSSVASSTAGVAADPKALAALQAAMAKVEWANAGWGTGPAAATNARGGAAVPASKPTAIAAPDVSDDEDDDEGMGDDDGADADSMMGSDLMFAAAPPPATKPKTKPAPAPVPPAVIAAASAAHKPSTPAPGSVQRGSSNSAPSSASKGILKKTDTSLNDSTSSIDIPGTQWEKGYTPGRNGAASGGSAGASVSGLAVPDSAARAAKKHRVEWKDQLEESAPAPPAAGASGDIDDDEDDDDNDVHAAVLAAARAGATAVANARAYSAADSPSSSAAAAMAEDNSDDEDMLSTRASSKGRDTGSVRAPTATPTTAPKPSPTIPSSTPAAYGSKAAAPAPGSTSAAAVARAGLMPPPPPRTAAKPTPTPAPAPAKAATPASYSKAITPQGQPIPQPLVQRYNASSAVFGGSAASGRPASAGGGAGSSGSSNKMKLASLIFDDSQDTDSIDQRRVPTTTSSAAGGLGNGVPANKIHTNAATPSYGNGLASRLPGSAPNRLQTAAAAPRSTPAPAPAAARPSAPYSAPSNMGKSSTAGATSKAGSLARPVPGSYAAAGRPGLGMSSTASSKGSVLSGMFKDLM